MCMTTRENDDDDVDYEVADDDIDLAAKVGEHSSYRAVRPVRPHHNIPEARSVCHHLHLRHHRHHMKCCH